jgi:hypothetical protein
MPAQRRKRSSRKGWNRHSASKAPAGGGSEPPDSFRAAIFKPFTGDLGQMVKRRMIRVGVTCNRTLYFVDAGARRKVRPPICPLGLKQASH